MIDDLKDLWQKRSTYIMVLPNIFNG